MGTNYYVVSRKTNKLAKDLSRTYKKYYDNDDLKDTITKAIMKKFQRTMKFLNDNGLESKAELFTDCMEDAVEKFVCDIRYNVLDSLDLEEREQIHIGKSSGGWLFCFQSQHTKINDVPVIWNSYDDVKNWLEKYVTEDNTFVILDEYGKKLTVKKFINLVDTIQKNKKNLENPDNFRYSRNVKGYRFSDGDFS